MLSPAVAQLHRMGEDDVVGQAGAKHLPDRALGGLALRELRLFRNAAHYCATRYSVSAPASRQKINASLLTRWPVMRWTMSA